MNDLYLTDEEIWGKEPTWEEQEIERLKKKIEELENKLEDKECCIEMAIEHIEKMWKCAENGNIYAITIIGLVRADLLTILQKE